MRIALACDHRGYRLKESLKRHLRRKGYEVIDFGTHSIRSCDYPRYGKKVAEALKGGRCERGILICYTGIGFSIVANKFPGIRAALCSSIKSATFSRQHNDANILNLASGVVGSAKARKIVTKWLTTDFLGGRHARRVRQISKIEKEIRR